MPIARAVACKSATRPPSQSVAVPLPTHCSGLFPIRPEPEGSDRRGPDDIADAAEQAGDLASDIDTLFDLDKEEKIPFARNRACLPNDTLLGSRNSLRDIRSHP